MATIRPLINPALIRMIERFPESKAGIRSLFKKSRHFKEICEDYDRCWKVKLHWQSQNTKQSEKLTVEYREIMRGLELEVQQFLSDYNNPRKSVKF